MVFAADRIRRRGQWERDIRTILSVVPNEHLLELDCVVVTTGLKKKKKPVAGLYLRKWKGMAATIQLDAGINTAPWPISRTAMARRSAIAAVLLHELGHHQQARSHGIKRSHEEADAEAYAVRWGRKLVPWHVGITGFLAVPLVRAGLYVRRIVLRRKKRSAEKG